MTAQVIEIAGTKMVLLTDDEYRSLVEDAEHYADIVAAVEAQKRREAGEEYVPAEVVRALIEGENPLKVWRKHRGMTLQALADKVGRKPSFIGKLEKGQNEGGIKLWQSLAKALDLDLDDLLVPLD